MEPKTYSKEQHAISITLIDKHALYILEKLRAHGHQAYLVGGSVRDLLLGFKPKDFDISTSAKPEEIKKIFRNCLLIGRRFRLAHIRFGKKIFEVATFRAGDPQDDSLIIHDNVWGTPVEDVLRRDFTINGLFYDSENQAIIDYVDGYPDIQKKYLRVIGKPYVRFKQDPVRMIRMIKFLARFGFEADPEANQALFDCRAEIVKSSQARILEELLRMLESGSSASFFKQMTDYGLMQILLPGIGRFLESNEGQEILSLLEEVDAIQNETKQKIDRSVTFTCLFFPMLHAHLHKHFIESNLPPHLGQVQSEASKIILENCLPFFKLPRRMRGKMTSILTSQYRITPFSKRKKKKLRIPKIVDFNLAIEFASIRARIEPGLLDTVQEWQEVLKQSKSPKKKNLSHASTEK